MLCQNGGEIKKQGIWRFLKSNPLPYPIKKGGERRWIMY